MKKAVKFLASMRFAMALLIVLVLACALSSLVTQGQTYAWYRQRYGERTATAIIATGLDDAYHSPWFIGLSAALLVSLAACNGRALPGLLRRTRAFRDPDSATAVGCDVSVEGVETPDRAFSALRMGPPRSDANREGRRRLFCAKGAFGLWGAWVCHLGVFLLILGFGLGQAAKQEYSVYGVPGQSKPIGETGFVMTIDDFAIDRNENDNVSQYRAAITVRDLRDRSDGRAESAEVSVNHPAKLFGMKFYQNAMGWAATLTVTRDGELLQQEPVCSGDFLRVRDKPELAILLNQLYPDYEFVPGSGPSTRTDEPVNPAYLYSIYYQDEMIGMNALMPDETITIDNYAATFSDPRRYTLIQVRRDPFTPLALAGGMVTLIGLALALYVRPRAVWAIETENGRYNLYGRCRKGGALFKEQVLRAAGQNEEANDDAQN